MKNCFIPIAALGLLSFLSSCALAPGIRTDVSARLVQLLTGTWKWYDQVYATGPTTMATNYWTNDNNQMFYFFRSDLSYSYSNFQVNAGITNNSIGNGDYSVDSSSNITIHLVHSNDVVTNSNMVFSGVTEFRSLSRIWSVDSAVFTWGSSFSLVLTYSGIASNYGDTALTNLVSVVSTNFVSNSVWGDPRDHDHEIKQ